MGYCLGVIQGEECPYPDLLQKDCCLGEECPGCLRLVPEQQVLLGPLRELQCRRLPARLVQLVRQFRPQVPKVQPVPQGLEPQAHPLF